MASPRTGTPHLLRRAVVPVALLVTLAASGAPAASQLGPLDCLNCAFDIVTINWTGTARPGGVALGGFEIRNTGESPDTYTITVTTDNESWIAESDPRQTDEVPPGTGLFAESGNNATFSVRVLVPEDAPASARSTITITVTSDNGEDLEESTTVEARATQIHAWRLECTPTVDAEKTKEVRLTLTATNTGNGRDRATLGYTPVDGLVVSDPAAFDAPAGAMREQTIRIGVGLRLDDGTYPVRWDLRSNGDRSFLTQCTSDLVVSGGTPADDDADRDDKESPAPLPLVALLACIWFAAHRKRQA